MKFSVYTLKCEHDKYYVGSTLTRMVSERYHNHKTGRGAIFCWNYKPLAICDTVSNLTSWDAMRMETTIVIDILKREGNLDAARGGEINYPMGSRFWVPRKLQYLCRKEE
jgi:predicted GIY-YIG superfamily endonuclease